MKKILVLVLFGILLVTLAGSAPGSKVENDKSNAEMQYTLPGPT